MRAKSIVYRTLTTNEFKAINGLIQSQGGGSQTYIDFPKGSISDTQWKEFLGEPVSQVNSGYKWNFKVNGLSLGETQESVEISSRRDSTNSLRDQYNNRLKIWSTAYGNFPDAQHPYDESNPIIVYLLKDTDSQFWAGWFYRNECSIDWFMNVELASVFFNKTKGASGYINFTKAIPFDKHERKWPFKYNETNTIMNRNLTQYSFQQIFYGAPGTGKSHTANEVAEQFSTVRTTFHPDSDYSTFVGAYKPTMAEVKMQVVPVVINKGISLDESNGTFKEKRITYKFVKQAFLKAYISAWHLFRDTCKEGQQLAPQFLIIEEINRGNCAQIFGDLFQLLDRKNGFSEYPIEADEDIVKAILDEAPEDGLSFGKDGLQLDTEQMAYIDSLYNKPGYQKRNIAEKICKGELLCLPNNFYIWATMNTSDQSLFPIDSAFKRRWDWKYVRISEGKTQDGQSLNYRIKFDVPDGSAVDVSWWEFLKAINKRIEDVTKSEDKQLGYFFCKPDKQSVEGGEYDIITAETFVGKVVFYLWNDVFKDYGFKSDIFKRENNGSKISFHDFYSEDAVVDKDTNPEGIDLKLVETFINKVIEGTKK